MRTTRKWAGGVVADGLAFDYPGRRVWGGLSFTVEDGQFLALRGESGSGKTTLLQCLGSLASPSAGALRVNGVEPGRIRGEERRAFRRSAVGFAFQNAGIVASWTVRQNLEVIGARANADDRDVRDAFDRFELPLSALASPAHRLSGGEQQRIALVRLVLQRPQLLLLDEPTASLDDENAARVSDFVAEHCKAGGTVIAATHDVRLSANADADLVLT
ncbi:putative ABC transport system ATP-binding protein [Clavibacter michiganensis]|uniref:ABC transporter ATP-binding protein n=1 Tax=Clavibacter michiganensis TaxID=28447 RepID=UPI00195709D7|nr:ABC transporter ATP-binding protein [Clavibacter michiganensis]MBM7413017.1 putative ABC transport system ATP-binding protein [Clavibacter michiganensis]MBM7413022.1 putative ABC transport system ATP-binding protein [Clavibacter michiganensis]